MSENKNKCKRKIPLFTQEYLEKNLMIKVKKVEFAIS